MLPETADSSVSGWGFWDARLWASLCVLATGLSHPLLLSSAKPSASSSLINMSSVWQSPPNSPVTSQHLGLAFPCQASAGVSNLPYCRETWLGAVSLHFWAWLTILQDHSTDSKDIIGMLKLQGVQMGQQRCALQKYGVWSERTSRKSRFALQDGEFIPPSDKCTKLKASWMESVASYKIGLWWVGNEKHGCDEMVSCS